MSSFSEDHAAGKHQQEIVEILEKIDQCFRGHERAICLIALIRMMAVMIAPTTKDKREEYLDLIPVTMRSILKKMDSIRKMESRK